MDKRNIPWKAEWKAAGLDPGPLSPEEEALVPRLEEENRAFLEKHPYRPAPKPAVPRTLRLTAWTLPLAAAAALMVFVTVPFPTDRTPGTGLEHLKGAGDPVLTVYRQGDTGSEKLASGAKVRPGDLLQAAYQVSKPLQGILLSVDGDGNVSVHLAQKGQSTALVPGGERNTPLSFELDRAPKFEAFFLCTSEKPFDLEPVRQVLKTKAWNTLAPGAFGPGIQFTVLALAKELDR